MKPVTIIIFVIALFMYVRFKTQQRITETITDIITPETPPDSPNIVSNIANTIINISKLLLNLLRTKKPEVTDDPIVVNDKIYIVDPGAYTINAHVKTNGVYLDSGIAWAWVMSKGRVNEMGHLMKILIDASYNEGIDPYFIIGLFVHETGFGTSNIWRKKFNGFGIGAFDATPMASAYEFGGQEGGIRLGVRWINNNYLNNPSDYRYSLTIADMNKYYATDPGWGQKIVNHMNDLRTYKP